MDKKEPVQPIGIYKLTEGEHKFIKESKELFERGNAWELLQYRPKVFKYLSEIALERRIDFLKSLFAYTSTWTFYTLQWVCDTMIEAYKNLLKASENSPILYLEILSTLYSMKETAKETLDEYIQKLTIAQAITAYHSIYIHAYTKEQLYLKINEEE